MLELLGTPRLRAGDGDATGIATGAEVAGDGVLRVTRPVALVAYLAAQGGWVPRAAIGSLFWPDLDDREARAFARVLVHRARKLPWVGARLEASGDRVRLDLPTDVAAFRAACARGDASAALAAYRGPFLDGVALGDAPSFDVWLDAERSHLAAAAAAVAHRAAEAADAEGDAAAAAVAWSRLAALEPLDAAVARRAVAALTAAGREGEARALARAHTERVRAQLGAEPDPEVARALQGARGAAPEPAIGLALPTLARFVGREAELAALEDALARGARLLAVTGMGGVGKSRLVAELRARQAGRFRDGAVHVALREDADEAAAIAGIERAFGWRLGTGARRERLVAALRDHEALLVLDGLSDPTPLLPLLAAVRDGAAGVRAVVAGHAPPALPDVVRCDLAGLPVERAGATPAPAPSPAARLVLDALAAAAPGVDPGPGAASDAERVARAVGGLPLALELAGAWGAAVGLAAVADACERGDPAFAAFAVPDRDGRRRSVDAVVEGTWARLRPRQREALAALTAFAGPVAAAVAEAVAGASPALLVGLSHAALLRPAGGGRLAMHELVRRVAVRERPPEAVARHAHHFLGAVAAEAPSLTGAAEATALARVVADLDELELAWLQAAGPVRAALTPTAVHAVGRVAELTDDAPRFRAWFEAAWAAGGPDAGQPFEDDVAAAVAVWLAHLRFAGGAGEASEALLDLAEAVGDARVRALARWQRATIVSAAGEHDRAATLLERAADDAEALGDADLLAGVLLARGNAVFFRDGDLDACEALLKRAHALHERSGSPRGLAAAAINLGAVANDRGDLAAAAAWFVRAAEHARAIGNRRLEGVAAGNLGGLALAERDADAAERHFDAAIAARRAVGDAVGVAFVRTRRATVLAHRGAVDAALLDLHEVVAALEPLGDVGMLVHALGTRARLLEALGRLPAAEADARAALDRVVREGAVEDALLALATAATVLAATGRAVPAGQAADAVLAHPAANFALRQRAEEAIARAGVRAGVRAGSATGGPDATGDLRSAVRAALEALSRPGHAPAA